VYNKNAIPMIEDIIIEPGGKTDDKKNQENIEKPP